MATGHRALFNNTIGSGNIASGDSAGINLTTGSNNIDIGNSAVAAESNTIRIGTEGTETNAHIAGIYSTLMGAADFNRDGHPDFVLFPRTTRATVIWYVNNNVRVVEHPVRRFLVAGS